MRRGAQLWPRAADRRAQRRRARGELRSTNLHTGERLEIEYFRDDAYVPEALAALEVSVARFSQRRASTPSIRS